MPLIIRQELLQDNADIFELNRVAFGGPAEARLVDQLRADKAVAVSLVAVADDRILGHILFSDLEILTSKGSIEAVALAPMAVLPGWQRRGIGASLIRLGAEKCRELKKSAILVLGHHDYYTRFGFSSALAKSLKSPYSDAGDDWMAKELEPGALLNVAGEVHYPEAFRLVS